MKFYRNAHVNAWTGKINFGSDALTATLHTASYTPNLDTDQFVTALGGTELATGGGYTAGGVTFTTKTVSYTTAASWSTSRANSTAYAVETIIKATASDTNTYLYRCAVAGTSAASAPTFSPTIGSSTTDGGVTWENVGLGVTTFVLTPNPTWSNATFTGVRYLVLSDRTPATAATQPLIGLHDFGSAQSGQGGAFTDQLNPLGTLMIFHP